MGSTVGLAGAAILKRKKGKIIILKAELSQSAKTRGAIPERRKEETEKFLQRI